MGEALKSFGAATTSVEQLWDDLNVPFPAWEARVRALISQKNPQVDAALTHSGFNLFSHPDATQEFIRDMMLWMVRHSNLEIRQRAEKHLSQSAIQIPDSYRREIEKAIQEGPDQEVKDITRQIHQEVGDITGELFLN